MLSSQNTVAALALFNLVWYVCRASVAGAVLNDRLNGELRTDENNATGILVQTTLILSMIGCASSFAGLLHKKEWTAASRLVGVGVGVIACMLDLLAFGYAIKQWELGDPRGDTLGGRAQFLGGGAVIQTVAQLTYVKVIFDTSPGADGDLASNKDADNVPAEKDLED